MSAATFKVKRITTGAYLPQYKEDTGAFEVYTATRCAIPVGERVRLPLGFTYSLPPATALLVQSCKAALQFGLEVSSYYENSSTVGLMIQLYNRGQQEIKLQVGDPIALLRIVQQTVAQIAETDDLSQAVAILIEEPIRTHIVAKSAPVWFFQTYAADPAGTADRYLDTECRQALTDFRASEDYQSSRNKPLAEAKYVWVLLNEATQSRITDDFNEARATIHQAARSPREDNISQPEDEIPEDEDNLDDLDDM